MIGVGIVAATLAAFWPTLSNDFIALGDDDAYVLSNPLIRTVDVGSVRQAFTTFHVGCYLPFVLLSYMFDFRLWGLEPFGYHLTNLAWHAVNALLVGCWVGLRTRHRAVAMLAALLFSLHPLRVESVAWVAERKDVMCAAFFLGALCAWELYRRASAKRWYALAVLSYLAALLSKGMAVTLPALLLWLDWCDHRPITRRTWRELWPFGALALLAGIVGFSAQGSQQLLKTHFPWTVNVLVAPYNMLFYAAKTIWPVALSYVYPYPSGDGTRTPMSWTGNEPAALSAVHLPWEFWIAPLIVGVLLAVIWRTRRTSHLALLGSGWFLMTLLPVVRLVPLGYVMAADRYTYIPSVGLALLAAVALVRLYERARSQRWLRRGLELGLTSLLLVLGVATWQRCLVWHDGVTLWSDVIAKEPRLANAYAARADTLMVQRQFDPAIRDYHAALQLTSTDATIYNGLGVAYGRAGRMAEAVAAFQRAIALSPQSPLTYLNWGTLCAKQGLVSQALALYQQALVFDPASAAAWHNLATQYERLGRPGEAITAYERAMQCDVQQPTTYFAAARLHEGLGEPGEALRCYEQVAAIAPHDPRVVRRATTAIERLRRVIARPPVEAVATHQRP